MTWRFGLSLVASISAALLLTGGALADSAISQPRQSELDNLFEQDCGSCHGLTRRGGLGSPLLPEALADKSDEVLVEIILDGPMRHIQTSHKHVVIPHIILALCQTHTVKSYF